MNRLPIQTTLTQKKRYNNIYIYILILITSIILMGYLVFHYFTSGRLASKLIEEKLISVIITGADNVEGKGRTDTILLAMYNPIVNSLGIISIPRDIRVRIKDKYEKINHIARNYSYNFLYKVIRDITGISADFYIRFDYKGFKEIVDLLGGVEIFNSEPMKYYDRSGNLYIEIPQGVFLLDGSKALDYVRFRANNMGDLGRIGRQQELIFSIFKKKNLASLVSDRKIVKELYKRLKTNFSLSDIFVGIKYYKKILNANFISERLYGTFKRINGIDFIEINQSLCKQQVLNFLKKMSRLRKQDDISAVKVQVLNASGISGAAKRIRNILVNSGVNVMEFGNAGFYNLDKSFILDRTGKIHAAEKIGQIISCNKVYPKPDNTQFIDTTIYIGKDLADKYVRQR